MEKQCHLLRDQEVEYLGKIKKWKEITTTGTMMEKMYREGFKAQLIEKNRSHASGLHAILEQVVGDNGNSGMVKEKINEIIEKAREYIN